MTAAVTITNLSKSFGTIKIVDCKKQIIEKGEHIAIVGPSGCGKTTLLNMIAQLDTTFSGTIDVQGSIAYIEQKELFFPWRTIKQNILLPKECTQTITLQVLREYKQYLHMFTLEKDAQFPDQWSGGMLQRASMIRALLQDKDIILADEPFSAIDSDARKQYVQLLKKEFKRTHKTVIWVTHSQEEAKFFADRIFTIHNQKLMELK